MLLSTVQFQMKWVWVCLKIVLDVWSCRFLSIILAVSSYSETVADVAESEDAESFMNVINIMTGYLEVIDIITNRTRRVSTCPYS